MSNSIDLAALTPKHLTDPTPAQINEAAVVLQQAFKADPLTPIFTANDPELQILLFKSGLGSAALGGAIHVLLAPSSPGPTDHGASALGDERIVAVAVWFPPGMSHNVTPEQRAAGWDAFMETAERKDPNLKAWWTGSFIPNLKRAHEDLLPNDFTKNAWHLHLFGVLPEFHGKGFGKKLFNYAKAQAESTKSPIVLETGTDVDIIIYGKLGLDVVGDTKIENIHGTGKMTVMVKKWD